MIPDTSGPNRHTTPIMRLADRLAAAWDVFRASDGRNIKVGNGATQAERDFARRNDPNGLHARIASLPATNLDEAIIRVAVLSATVNTLAIDLEAGLRSVAQAMSGMVAHAEAAGIELHPACRAYFVRRVAPPSGEA